MTGGAGFIGSHVVDVYRAAGHEVAVIDNLSTGARENLAPDVRLYEVDIRDAEVDSVVADFRPDVINHHAAQANVPASVKDPVTDASINVLGSLNLLRAAATHGTRKIVYASSGGAMYGDPDPATLPLKEDAPRRPLSPYGASKQAFELWLGAFQRTFGLHYTVVRYANVYGPRQGLREEGAVVAAFATRMSSDQPVTIDGDGEQTRDFVYVGDCAQANLQALSHGDGSAVNIGTGREVSVNDIFRLMAELTGYAQEPRFGPARQGDVRRISLDPGEAHRVLYWEAKMPFDQGLRETIGYFARTQG